MTTATTPTRKPRNDAAVLDTLDSYVRICWRLMQDYRRLAKACPIYSPEWRTNRDMMHFHKNSLLTLIRVRRAGRRGF